MRRFSAVLLFVLVLVGVAAAQTSGPKINEWVTFAPEEEEFQVEVPVELTASRFKADPLNPDLSRRYLNSFEDTYFFVFSDNPKTPEQFDFVSKVISVFKGKRDKIKLEDLNGQRIHFQEADFHHEILTIAGRKRIYVFQTISRDRNSPLVSRFFAGIRPSVKKPVILAPDQIMVEIPTNVENDILPEPKDNALQTARVGVSFHNDVRVAGNPKKRQKNESGIFEAMINSTPAPEYPSFAQFYEITGTVELRVVFRPDGTIGEITPLATLPCLLTFQAVEAAKKVQFTAKRVNDRSQPIEKQVEYRYFFR